MISRRETKPAKAKAKPKPSKKVKTHVAVARPHVKHKTASLAPVLVEAGSRSKSSLRHLEQGAGPLMDEIGQIVDAIHATVPKPAEIVIVYREKRSSSSGFTSPFGLFF
jgi:hypothetical protein